MLKKIFSSELGKGSFTLLILFNLFNLFSFLFHFVSARMLGASDYGILATLMGIGFILSIPGEAIQLIISRYTTKFYFKKEKGKIKGLVKKSLRKFLWISVISIIIMFFLSPIIGKFLYIDPKLIAFLSLILFGVFILPVNRGVLQGEKKFFKLGINISIESFSKFIFAVILISLGFGVYGAVGAVVVSLFLSIIISFFFIKDILKTKSDENSIKGIYPYSWLVLISTGCIILFYSMDVILAKRFFSPEDVGLYAAISTLGKMIFWGTAPISKAMFPLVSERNEEKNNSRDLIKKSLFLVTGISLVGLFIYWLFPELVLKIVYGEDYLGFSNLLIYIGFSMMLLAINNIFVYNALSKGRKINLGLIFFVILQVILLFLFHSSVLQFVTILVISNLLMTIFFVTDYLINR